MIVHDRRNFLKGGSFAIGALAAGSRTAAAELNATALPAIGTQVAGFGWELCNLSDDGANVYVEVRNKMVLQAIDLDISASILHDRRTGFAEVLCLAGLSQQAPPSFTSSAAAYINLPWCTNFGPMTPDNPNRLELVLDGGLIQNRLLAVILKTWVPPGGSGSATSRHVSASPFLSVNAGDYLVFHMDHAGVPVDAEIQVVLNYQLV